MITGHFRHDGRVPRTFGGAGRRSAALRCRGHPRVVAGLAAQSTLSNLFAGLQLAFSDWLRLDDVVVVEGEWAGSRTSPSAQALPRTRIDLSTQRRLDRTVRPSAEDGRRYGDANVFSGSPDAAERGATFARRDETAAAVRPPER